MTVQRIASMTRQGSTIISVGFIVLCILITTKALAGMLGGSLVAHLVAVGIVGALVILIGNVILVRFHQDAPTAAVHAPLTLHQHPSDAA